MWCWTSLVVQWLSIHLPVQGMWVQSLVWEDATYHGTNKPFYHNYWRPSALEPELCNRKSQCNEWEACAPQLESSPPLAAREKALARLEDPALPTPPASSTSSRWETRFFLPLQERFWSWSGSGSGVCRQSPCCCAPFPTRTSRASCLPCCLNTPSLPRIFWKSQVLQQGLQAVCIWTHILCKHRTSPDCLPLAHCLPIWP